MIVRKSRKEQWKTNAEAERKQFDLHFRKPGEYEVRFHIVETPRPWGNHMQNSTVEVLKEPDEL